MITRKKLIWGGACLAAGVFLATVFTALGRWTAPIPAQHVSKLQEMADKLKSMEALGAPIFPANFDRHIAYPWLYAAEAGVQGDGLTDDTAALQTAFTAAQTGCRKFYLPASTYIFNKAAGNLFDSATDRLEFWGDGAGQTTLKQTDNVALTNGVKVIRFTGRGQRVHDLTVSGGANPTGCGITAATVVNGGGSYVNGDTITLAIPALTGIYQNTAIVLNVTNAAAGVIQAGGVTVNKVGSWSQPYTLAGGGTQASTSGIGTGATFTLTWNASLFQQLAIIADTGAFDAVIERCEVVGIYGGNTAGGVGISCGSVWNQYEYTPTLGTSVSAGAVATVTPAAVGTGPPGYYGMAASRRLDVDTAVASSRQTAVMGQITTTANAGTGYAVTDVLTQSGGTATTQATFYVGGIGAVTVTVVAGGANYSNGNIISVDRQNGSVINDPPTGAVTTLTVTNSSGGVVQAAGLSITTNGHYSTSPGAGTLTTTAVTGTGSGCTVTLTYGLAEVGCLESAGASAVAAGGTLYLAGDYLLCSGGTFGKPAIYRVTAVTAGGVVTTVKMVDPGSYSSAPGNPVSTTAWSGAGHAASAGTGCTLTLNAFVFRNGPSVSCGKYSVSPTNPITLTGGTGTLGKVTTYFGPEQVIPFYDDKTTFSAYFQLDHTSAAPCGAWATGTGQHCVVRDCYIHDSPYCTGITGTGSGCVFDNIRITNMGVGNTQGGIYWQGNNTVFRNCYCEGIGGFSYQIQESVPNLEGNSNKLIGCYSVDPGVYHVVVDQAGSPNAIQGSNNNQASPNSPLGDVMNRACLLEGCTFRCSNQKTFQPINAVAINAPTDIIGCTFEDASGVVNTSTSGGTWITFTAAGGTPDGTRILGCHFRMVNSKECNTIIGGGCNNLVIANNFFENISSPSGNANAVTMQGNTDCVITGNIVTLSNTFGSTFFLLGTRTDFGFNKIIGGQPGLGSQKPFAFGSAGAGCSIHDNDTSQMPTSSAPCQYGNALAGDIYNNNWGATTKGFRLSGATPNLATNYYNNAGGVQSGGVAASALTKASGRLIQVQSGGTLVAGNLVKWTGGQVISTATGDAATTPAAGFACSSNATTLWVMVAGQPGTEFPAANVDAAWTAGHLGVNSVTSNGKIHDNGSDATPANIAALTAGQFYCIFLDTGGSAGTSRVLCFTR